MTKTRCSSDFKFSSLEQKLVEKQPTFNSALKVLKETSIHYYNADLPLNLLRSPSRKSDKIAVYFNSLRSLILLLESTPLTFCSLLQSSWDARVTSGIKNNLPDLLNRSITI